MTTKNSDDIIQRYKSLSRIEISPDEQREIWEKVEQKVNVTSSAQMRRRRRSLTSMCAGAAAVLIVLGGGIFTYSNIRTQPTVGGQAAGGPGTDVKPHLVYSSREVVPTGVIAVKMQNQQDGWAAQTDGALLHTSDGGKHWSVQFSDSSILFKLDCLDSVDKGWVMGADLHKGPVLVHSTDDGQTWTREDNVPKAAYREQFISASTGFVIAESQTNPGTSSVYRTTDGGQSWTDLMMPHAMEMDFTSAQAGFVLSGDEKDGYVLQHVQDIDATSTSWDGERLALPKSIPPFSTWIRRMYLAAQGNNSVWLAGTWTDSTNKPHFAAFYTDDKGEIWNAAGNLPGLSNGTALQATPNQHTTLINGVPGMIDCFHTFQGNEAYAVVDDGSMTGKKELILFKDKGLSVLSYPLAMKGYNELTAFWLTDETHGVAVTMTERKGTTKFYHYMFAGSTGK